MKIFLIILEVLLTCYIVINILLGMGTLSDYIHLICMVVVGALALIKQCA